MLERSRTGGIAPEMPDFTAPAIRAPIASRQLTLIGPSNCHVWSKLQPARFRTYHTSILMLRYLNGAGLRGFGNRFGLCLSSVKFSMQ